MLNKKKSEALYQELALKLNEIISNQWDQILFYSEVMEGMSSIYFVFYETETKQMRDMGSLIDEVGGVHSDKHVGWTTELSNIAFELNDAFIEEGNERWTTMTFILNNDGKFKVDFGYEDLESTDEVERRIAWKAKYL